MQSPGAPDFGGISQAFNSPLQTIRDDFGTIRLDHIFSESDTLGAIYTIDDSADFTPTSTNAYSTDIASLREQVASLQETHVFSPAVVNTARFGFSRAGYFFTGEPTPGTPAADLPGFLAGDPIGALVVGGSAASNPAARVEPRGEQQRKQPAGGAQPLYRGRPGVVHPRPPAIHFRRMDPAACSPTRLSRSANMGKLRSPVCKRFCREPLALFCSIPRPRRSAGGRLFGALYIEDVIRLTPSLHAFTWVPHGVFQRLE